jgi:hypothetical protein
MPGVDPADSVSEQFVVTWRRARHTANVAASTHLGGQAVTRQTDADRPTPERFVI